MLFAKQNKHENEHVSNKNFKNVKAEKEVLVYDEPQSTKEYLTLYAPNDESSIEPQVIQFNPESSEYSTFFDPSQVDMTGKSYHLFNIDQSQVKNTYPTFITPKSPQVKTGLRKALCQS